MPVRQDMIVHIPVPNYEFGMSTIEGIEVGYITIKDGKYEGVTFIVREIAFVEAEGECMLSVSYHAMRDVPDSLEFEQVVCAIIHDKMMSSK